MALDNTQLEALIEDIFADNITQEISEADLRLVTNSIREIIFPGTSTGNLGLAYAPARTYDIIKDGKFLYAEYDNKLWKWKNAVPGNVTPVEGASWTEVSKSAGSAFVEWKFEAVYAEGLIIVFFDGRFYQLLELVRPFQTFDLPLELGQGKWLDLTTEIPSGLENETIRYDNSNNPVSNDALQNDGVNIVIKSKITSPSVVIKNIGNFLGNLLSTLITSNRNYELPNKDGTFAMLSDVNDAVTGVASIQGDYNASTNTPDLDTAPSGILKGYMYIVTVAGTFFSEDVDAGDSLIAKNDNPVALGDWIRIEKNNDYTLARVLALANTTGGTDILMGEDVLELSNVFFVGKQTIRAVGSKIWIQGFGELEIFTSDEITFRSIAGINIKYGHLRIYDGLTSNSVVFDASGITNTRAAVFPDKSGTIAYLDDVAPIKSGERAAGTFASNPKVSTVTFAKPFIDANYSVNIIGEDGRSWTVPTASKLAGSFVIDSNSNTAPSFPVMWTAIKHGEFN